MSQESAREVGVSSTGDQSSQDVIELEKTRLLFRNAGLAQSVAVINATLLLYILGEFSPPGWAVGWWLASLTLAAARFALARRFLASEVCPADAHRWKRRALLGALAAGLLWGGGGAAMMHAGSTSTRLFVALVMSGMVAGAVPILSAVPAAFRAYAWAVLPPAIATAAIDFRGPNDWVLALVGVVLMFALLRSARYFHDSLDSSIRLALRMKQMAAQIEESRAAAEAASAAKSRFLATMSHEIRTPMNGILGMAQLLLFADGEPAETREYARTILNSGHTLLTLLNDILDLSKVEAGKLELSRREFAPALLVSETATLFAEMAAAKQIALAAAWKGPESASYWGDPVRLRQMLSNFVNNAIKFTAEGFVRIEARQVEAPSRVPMLEFSVTDSGIGIGAEQQALLFQPFSQLDSSNTREFGGTGLGLSITKSLAQLMGGNVGVDSDVGKGARFWFCIPADIATPAEAGGETGKDDLPGMADTAGVVSGRRIVLAEDNAVSRKVMEVILTRSGASIESVEDGRQLVDLVERGPTPDLVLLDCQMPVMDGFAATREIRTWEQANGKGRVPIVALTASAFDEDRQRCLAAGMDDFLTKPVELSELHLVLVKWLSSPS